MEFKPEIGIQTLNTNGGGKNILKAVVRKEANTLLKQMPQQKSPMYFYLKYFYSF